MLVALLQLNLALSQQSIFKTYTVGDGLVNNDIRKIYQDSKGFFWISTWEGLSKYDGNHFTNFTETNGLSHNLVNDIAETKDGDIYVALNNGSVDVIRHDKVKVKGIFQNVVINKFFPDEKYGLVASTDNSGVISINGNHLTVLAAHNSNAIYNFAPFNDSLLVAASDPLPVFVFNKQFRVWSFFGKRLEQTVANCVYKDDQNRIWLGTTTGLKLVAIDPDQKRISFPSPPAPFNDPRLQSVNISSIFQQKNGNIWIGTSLGLVNVLPDGQLIRLTEADGLPSRSVNYIFDDREHNLWIGTTQGLAKIPRSGPIPIHNPAVNEPQSFADLVKKISPRQLLLSSGGWFYRYTMQTGKIEKIFQPKKEKQFACVSNSKPFRFIYDGEILQYDSVANRLRAVKKNPAVEFAFSAAALDDHIILLGTFNDLVISDRQRSYHDSTFNMRINNLLLDEAGYVWIGTWDRGLYRGKYDKKEKKWIDITHFTQLPDERIRSLFEDRKGNIWIGTRFSGVIELENKTAASQPIHFDQRSGLSSNWIRDFSEDDKGNIWVATMSGVDKLVRKENSYSVFNYSRVMNFFANINFVTHISGNILLCSSAIGMFEIKDEELEKLSPQAVQLTKISLGQDEIYAQNASEKTRLPYSRNHASFEFTTPIYLNEKEILYSYRLKGSVDTSWSIPSNNHSVQFASLEPGHYSFEVRMLGWNGSYGPVTAFDFSVRYPYWRTWWFYAMIIAVMLLLLYGLYRYRIRQLVKLQKMRNKIATDLHDDIGSTLTNIGILSELSKKNLEQSPVAEKYLERITEESVASQQALDDIIWSVNSRNDNLRELEARMRRYIAEVFESGNISCHFQFESSTDGGRLNMEQRRDLYLVFKECMNNIHKHASAKNISVSISVKNGILQMHINDDGKGFDPEIITDRNGLKNLKTRVEKWRGILKINTGVGSGSDIEITMPVK